LQLKRGSNNAACLTGGMSMTIGRGAAARAQNTRALLSGLLTMTVLWGTLLSLPAQAQQGTAAKSAIPTAKSRKSIFKGAGSGSLTAKSLEGKELGECPLQHTDVSAKISGFVARVTVKQRFHNPYSTKIEAVYSFPLSDSGAVDDMVLKVGDRTIHGTIKKREEARQIYEEARESGYVASLLEQERPNIFTQSVANIEPGKTIEVTLQYVDMLPFAGGRYTFAFPTVVGPRFIPNTLTTSSQEQLNWTGSNMPASFQSPQKNVNIVQSVARPEPTPAVPDANLVTPPILKPGFRSGHDISITVDLDSGVPFRDAHSRSHLVNLQPLNNHSAHIELAPTDAIPNKDFVLSWDVCDGAIRSACMAHKTGSSGYFNLVLMPPKRVKQSEVSPKEMIFVIDRSGSQEGAPLEKAKETMNYILDNMNPQDTFQVLSFSNEAETLFDKPQAASESMKKKAHAYVNSLEANGGTWMGPAIEQVCNMPSDPGRLRIVTLMTDGYIGNDMEILGLVRKYRGLSRWFSFGTGTSVNRFLIDGVANEGGGEAEYVLLNSPGEKIARHFYDKISSPVLTDVSVKVEGVDAKDIFPRQISDLWARRPLYIKGRYTKPGIGKITMSGFAGGKAYKQEMTFDFPNEEQANPGVPSVWARSAVDALMSEDWFSAQIGKPNPKIHDAIVEIALAHHIMTQYTSFVAVDTAQVTPGQSIKVDVPVEIPAGVSFEGIFGKPAAARVPFNRTTVIHLADDPTSPKPASVPTPSPSYQSWGGGQAAVNDEFASGGTGMQGVGRSNGNSPNTWTQTNQAGGFQAAPTLQGASNGTIGAQGISGGAVTGVNTVGPIIASVDEDATADTDEDTAGEVRVTNQSNLEAVLKLMRGALDLIILFTGAGAIVNGIIKLMRKDRKGGLKAMLWGAGWLALGFIFSPLLLVYGAVTLWKRRKKQQVS